MYCDNTKIILAFHYLLNGKVEFLNGCLFHVAIVWIQLKQSRQASMYTLMNHISDVVQRKSRGPEGSRPARSLADAFPYYLLIRMRINCHRWEQTLRKVSKTR